jgi:hypothetical protein
LPDLGLVTLRAGQASTTLQILADHILFTDLKTSRPSIKSNPLVCVGGTLCMSAVLEHNSGCDGLIMVPHILAPPMAGTPSAPVEPSLPLSMNERETKITIINAGCVKIPLSEFHCLRSLRGANVKWWRDYQGIWIGPVEKRPRR